MLPATTAPSVSRDQYWRPAAEFGIDVPSYEICNKYARARPGMVEAARNTANHWPTSFVVPEIERDSASGGPFSASICASATDFLWLVRGYSGADEIGFLAHPLCAHYIALRCGSTPDKPRYTNTQFPALFGAPPIRGTVHLYCADGNHPDDVSAAGISECELATAACKRVIHAIAEHVRGCPCVQRVD